MVTKSTHTKRQCPRGYVPGSSRGPRTAVTLLAQVADLQRGQRIRERREELHLTQPAVVDLMEKAAYALPRSHELHPDNAGKAPVTLRGYQTYERGGGIVWEKAKLLAQVLQVDVEVLLNGDRRGEAPDPFPPIRRENGEDRLARMEQRLIGHAEHIEALLAQQDGVLREIKTEQAALRKLIAEQRELKAETDQIHRAILEIVAPHPPAEEPGPAEASARSGRAKKKRAATPSTR